MAAQESQPNGLPILSHRGGFNDDDPPNALNPDECTLAENVEFFESLLGERRAGTTALDLTSSGLTTETHGAHLSQWFPTNVPTLPEFIAVSVTPSTSVKAARRDTGGTWHALTPNDAINNTAPTVFAIVTQAFDGKIFIAYRSSEDRLHVWDGTNWRRTGLAQPAAPTAADTGTAGKFSGTRYYRVRYTIMSGSEVITRSEPSDVLTFAPSGSKNGVTVTKPASISESETHWELEASFDNVDFYRIATTAVGTTTYTDQVSGPKTYPTALISAPASTDGTSITYVLLSNQAAQLALTGTVPMGQYTSDASNIPGRGWLGYDNPGTANPTGYIPFTNIVGWIAQQNWWASPDVAATVESQVSLGNGGDYADVGTLSDAVGAYLTIQSARYLCVDGDRLIYGGHWTDTEQMSTVGWTPVTSDPGVGNSERAPIVTTGGTDIVTQAFIDNFDNGPLTGLAASTFGSWYAFKWQGIFSAVRTNDPTNAYDIQKSNPTRGAMPGSIIKGADANGVGIIFFLDPFVGPCALLAGGVVKEIRGLRGTWARVNTKATSVICCGCWYPRKKQIIWWVSVDGGNSPSFGIKLQTSELREMPDGTLGRGWSTITGNAAAAFCAASLTYTVGNLTTDIPFIGRQNASLFFRCDTGTDDAGTAFTGTVTGRPHYIAGLLQKWGSLTASLLAKANSNGSVKLNLVRDTGVETVPGTAQTLAAVGSETQVIKDLDDSVISECRAVQIQLTDGQAGKDWAVDRVDLKPRPEEQVPG